MSPIKASSKRGTRTQSPAVLVRSRNWKEETTSISTKIKRNRESERAKERERKHARVYSFSLEKGWPKWPTYSNHEPNRPELTEPNRTEPKPDLIPPKTRGCLIASDVKDQIYFYIMDFLIAFPVNDMDVGIHITIRVEDFCFIVRSFQFTPSVSL